jgi:hypothetical protein
MEIKTKHFAPSDVVSNTVELSCEMELTKQGSTMVLQDTRWYVGDHFHSLNVVLFLLCGLNNQLVLLLRVLR